ncbi:hypothetical protein RIF23_10330 [Lipingzhangella sp. LS1_29]|uniref:Uncharacterized protein n=1 Tax=Lipingzhangella rawalii TaxID=2055835 RepID=A0ABU2H7B8_9ACTN|nr:hypothetical protein [Lipingzhangella rawalii]MDS1270695.1 hypothetical protein [Lipingzhangella rawalii]
MPEPPGPTDAERGVLVGLDLRGIQDFVYEGRRLLDAIGRSALVGDLVRTVPVRGEPDIADLLRGIDCTTIRDTGGALWVAFHGEQAARDARGFTAEYTRRLRETSVRIQPVVKHLRYGADDTEAKTLADAVRDIGRLLAAESRDHSHTPVLGYGVTAICEVTGRPAETVDPDRGRETPDRPDEAAPERVARDVRHARARGRTWHQQKNEDWLAELPPFRGIPLDLPMDVEQLGREMGEVSRQAVIHLDFNDLGKTLHAHADAQHGTTDFTTRMRELSGQVRTLTEGLARAMTRAVTNALQEESDAEPWPVLRGTLPNQLLRVATHRDRSGMDFVKVPLRPIVAGGDDLTIICDGRLAWSLTRFALDWLDRVEVAEGDPRHPFTELGPNPDWDIEREVGDQGAVTGVPTMKVGIAVQPVGAPLIAGYQISEALAKRAKDHRRDMRTTGDDDDHAVVWSLDFDTPERVMDRLQHRATGTGDPLTAQPMLGSEFRDFLTTYFAVAGDRPHSLRGPTWRENRSWLIGDLMKLLEQGHDLAAELQRRKSLELPHQLPEHADRRDDTDARARLYEALQLIDLHLDVNLEEVP